MVAEESLRAGNVMLALQQLQDQIRKQPASAQPRVFLFQLLAVLGRWEKAMTQLNVLGELDASTLTMVRTYREILRCEALRAQVFAGQRSPLIFGDPVQWLALLFEALRLTATGHHAQAQTVREQAFEAAPATPGTLDGQPFTWIADADTRLGPVIEAIVNGRYYWIPFQRIRSIQLEAPVDLRDLVWMPAQFTWRNGGETVGFIPARYPDSEASSDPAIQLGRKTEWQECEGDAFLGLGQRLLATDGGERPLLEIRSITLADDAAADAVADAASAE